MKKLLYFIVPVVALSIASCQKEVSVEKVPEGVERTVTFVTSNEAVTKTYLETETESRFMTALPIRWLQMLPKTEPRAHSLHL